MPELEERQPVSQQGPEWEEPSESGRRVPDESQLVVERSLLAGSYFGVGTDSSVCFERPADLRVCSAAHPLSSLAGWRVPVAYVDCRREPFRRSFRSQRN